MSGSEESLSRGELLAALVDRDATIAALLAEIAELKRRLGMDASNSSMPPSSECLGARARRNRRRERKPPDRKRGGQPGHPGSGLPRAAVPDAVVVVGPQACRAAGRIFPVWPGWSLSRCRYSTFRRSSSR